MKKIIKIIINLFSNFFVFMLKKSNFGRYVLDEISGSNNRREKTVVYNNIRLKFYIPNRLSYYRVNTFNTKEPETLNWIDKFEKKLLFGMLGLISDFIAVTLQKNENVRYLLLNLQFLTLNG